jgi:hypothetical protein
MEESGSPPPDIPGISVKVAETRVLYVTALTLSSICRTMHPSDALRSGSKGLGTKARMSPGGKSK